MEREELQQLIYDYFFEDLDSRFRSKLVNEILELEVTFSDIVKRLRLSRGNVTKWNDAIKNQKIPNWKLETFVRIWAMFGIQPQLPIWSSKYDAICSTINFINARCLDSENKLSTEELPWLAYFLYTDVGRVALTTADKSVKLIATNRVNKFVESVGGLIPEAPNKTLSEYGPAFVLFTECIPNILNEAYEDEPFGSK